MQSLRRWSKPAHGVPSGFFGVLAALGTALTLAWYMARRIAEPIADLADAAKAVSTGGDVAVPATRRIDEIAHLHDTLREASLTVHEREERRLSTLQSRLAGRR
ncbi:MAG TPA: hypothetical protein VGO84_05100 [Burkholderiales bacterium]|nr:hypothetical protein [Burkholderiales bacterium]